MESEKAFTVTYTMLAFIHEQGIPGDISLSAYNHIITIYKCRNYLMFRDSYF